MYSLLSGPHGPQKQITWWTPRLYEYMTTNYFYLKADNLFPKPQPLSLNISFRKIHVPCLSGHIWKVPHKVAHLILYCCHDKPWWCQSTSPLGARHKLKCMLYLIVRPVHVENIPQRASTLRYVLQTIHAWLGHVDPRLAWVFNQSCCVRRLWIGWKRLNLASHFRVIHSAKKVNWVIRSVANSWQ